MSEGSVQGDSNNDKLMVGSEHLLFLNFVLCLKIPIMTIWTNQNTFYLSTFHLCLKIPESIDQFLTNV